MTNPLSPAAQAVLDAAFPVYDEENLYIVSGEQHAGMIAAAALRAAADQVVPEEPLNGGDQRWMYERDTRQESRTQLLAIAAELEVQPVAKEPMIPSHCRGHGIAVYRDGFHAGYKEALARSANALPTPEAINQSPN